MIYDKALHEAGRATTTLKPLGLHTQIILYVTNWDYVSQTDRLNKDHEDPLHYTDRIGRYTPPAGNGCVKDIFGHTHEAPCL